MKLNINGKSVEVADDLLLKAIEEKKESIDVKSDALVIRTTEEEASYTENLRKDSTPAGIEIGRKEVLKGLGIEGEGLHKSDAKTIEAVNNLINGKVTAELESAKIEPNKKVEELTKDKNTLQETVRTLTSEKETLSNDFAGYKKNQKINSVLSKLVPDNTVIPKGQVLKLMTDTIKVDINENGQVFGIGEDGQPLKDKATLELLPLENVVSGYFDKNPHFLSKTKGGAGGTDTSGANGKQSFEDFTKELETKGIAPNSEEANALLKVKMDAGQLDMD